MEQSIQCILFSIWTLEMLNKLFYTILFINRDKFVWANKHALFMLTCLKLCIPCYFSTAIVCKFTWVHNYVFLLTLLKFICVITRNRVSSVQLLLMWGKLLAFILHKSQSWTFSTSFLFTFFLYLGKNQLPASPNISSI